MHSTVARPSFATTTFSCDRHLYSVVQRKANYSNKERPRLKDVKEAAFKYLGVSKTSDVRSLLKELNIHFDLRLTSAWCAIAWELIPHLKRRLELRRMSKGMKVGIINCPGSLEKLQPFTICGIDNGMALLDYVAPLYQVEQLYLWE